MNGLKNLKMKNTESEKDLRRMAISDFYEQECHSAIYWDLVRKAYLYKQ